MDILFPIQYFYPNHGGGPSLSVYWMAKALVQAGNRVTVVTTSIDIGSDYSVDVWHNVDGIKVLYCSSQAKLILQSIRALKKCDVLHLTSFCFRPSVLLACYSCFFSSKRVVWSPRGELADAAVNGRFVKRIAFFLYGVLFKKRIVFHGTSVKEIKEIKSTLGKCQTVHLPNYLELSPRINCPQKHILLYLGRISPIKSLDKLIDALKRSKTFMQSDYIFLMAGRAFVSEEIAYEDRLRKKVYELGLRERVIFLGAVGGAKKDELLSETYFSFLVSESENFGNVVVEAMAQGTPVVTSKGTPWAVLKERSLGYSVDNNPDTLSKVIDEIISLPEPYYQDLRARVYEFCKEEFSVYDNVDKWMNVYESLLKGDLGCNFGV